MPLIVSEPNVTRQALIALIGKRTPVSKSISEDEVSYWCSVVARTLALNCDSPRIGHCMLRPIRVNGYYKIEVSGDETFISEILDIVAILYKSGAPVYVRKPERYLALLDVSE